MQRATIGVNVQEQSNDKGELEINIFSGWIGSKGSREFRDYMMKAMEELRDRVVEKCGSR